MEETIELNGMQYTLMYEHKRKFLKNGQLDNHGGVTIAFIKDRGVDTRLFEAEAKCCKKDIYNKKRGRTIAKGRLLKLINPKQFVY